MPKNKDTQPKTPKEWCEKRGKPYTPALDECWELARRADPADRLLMLYWAKGALAASQSSAKQ